MSQFCVVYLRVGTPYLIYLRHPAALALIPTHKQGLGKARFGRNWVLTADFLRATVLRTADLQVAACTVLAQLCSRANLPLRALGRGAGR